MKEQNRNNKQSEMYHSFDSLESEDGEPQVQGYKTTQRIEGLGL